ncbi:MAG: SPFH domain-containing protein [Patescibacteria group bacterium]
MLFIILMSLWFMVAAGLLLVALRTKMPALAESSEYTDEISPAKVKTATISLGGLLLLVWVIVMLWQSILIVSAGKVKVGTLLGTVQESSYNQGFHLVNPFLSFNEFSVRRQILEFQSGSADNNGDNVVAVSSDNLPLDVDVTYAFRLNPRYAWWVYRHIGNEETFINDLVSQAARSATRSVAAHFDSNEATTTNRDGLARRMGQDFRGRLIEDMVLQGLPREQAEQVFTVLPVQLRRVLPPARVQSAIADRAASLQDLERQRTLTQIAVQEAERRAQEGAGVRRLFEELPTGFSAPEISIVLNAIANKERADAQMLAVRNGRVSVMVMDGGGNVTVPPPAK